MSYPGKIEMKVEIDVDDAIDSINWDAKDYAEQALSYIPHDKIFKGLQDGLTNSEILDMIPISDIKDYYEKHIIDKLWRGHLCI